MSYCHIVVEVKLPNAGRQKGGAATPWPQETAKTRLEQASVSSWYIESWWI